MKLSIIVIDGQHCQASFSSVLWRFPCTVPLADLKKKTSSLRENPNEFVVEREREYLGHLKMLTILLKYLDHLEGGVSGDFSF